MVLYRKQILLSPTNFIFMGLWPMIGALFMAYLFIKVIPGLNAETLWVGLGAMALGLIPMLSLIHIWRSMRVRTW